MSFTGMQAAERVSPLTVLVRGAVERWLAPSILQEIAQQTGMNGYERKVTLQALFAIMLDAVMGMQPTVHAAAVARREQWNGSVQALYTKLARVDPQFSMGLVAHTAAGLGPLLKSTLPRRQTFPAGCVKLLDGTMPEGSEHRLGVLRQLKAAGLPAKMVIVYDRDTGLCERVAADEDAYTSEKTLAESLLAEAIAREIYVGDRAFCTCRLMGRVEDRKAFFVFRELTEDMVFEQQGQEKACGRCSTGKIWEAKVRVVDRATGRTWDLRRIHIRLDKPTSSGDTDLWLLTNLPASYSARVIAELYRDRWGIERYFHSIKHELHGEIPSLGEPRAAIFALCVALAASNVLMMIVHLRPGLSRAPSKLSAYYMTLEIGHSYAAIEALTTSRDWQTVANLSPNEFWEWAQRLAERIPWSRYATHPRGPKQPQPKRISGKNRHHYSTYRLIKAKKEHNTAC
jgi:hypothetical protein